MGRYGLVGLIAVTVHAAVAYALLWIAGIPALISHTVGFLAGFVVSGLGHVRFTFMGLETISPALTRYFLISLGALGISQLVLLGLLHLLDWSPAFAQGGAIVTGAGLSYAGSRYWAFRQG